MATPMSGVDILLKINTGTEAVPVWTEVAFQRGATLNRSAETIDTSFKGSGNWKSAVAGLKEWSVDADGLYVFGATEFDGLEDAFDGRVSIMIELIDSLTGKGYRGTCFIVDFPVEAPYDGELTYSLSLMGNGALTKVTGSMVEAMKLTALAFGTVNVSDNLLTEANALVADGYTVTVLSADLTKIAITGIATEAGEGTIAFTVTEDANPTNTANTPVLAITVEA